MMEVDVLAFSVLVLIYIFLVELRIKLTPKGIAYATSPAQSYLSCFKHEHDEQPRGSQKINLNSLLGGTEDP